MALVYPGLKPMNVSKDAKYSVRTEDGEWVVKLEYVAGSRVRWLLSTGRHPDLVEMVNEVKREYAGVEGGAFYINEFHDVLVKANDECYFAGYYTHTVEFDFEGHLISPRAPAELSPGDPWLGPHVGIRYKLKAGGDDISWERQEGRITEEHRLSDHYHRDDVARLCQRLSQHKGTDGGRIYINECGEFFSPPRGSAEFIYLGHLEDDVWFPMPEGVPRD